MENSELNLQIFQGAGFQRGAVHAGSSTGMTAPGFFAAGVYATRVEEPK